LTAKFGDLGYISAAMIARLFTAILLAIGAALAQAQPVPPGELVRARLIAEHQSVQPGQIAWVAVHLTMRPDWHVYFRNPGDAGLPTSVEWSLPEAWRAGEIAWPRPIRFETGGLASFGYKDQVALLVPLHVPVDARPGSNAELGAQVTWLACEIVCIPGDASVRLALPVAASSPALDPAHVELINATRARLPAQSGFVARAEIAGERLMLTMPVVPIYGVGSVNVTFVPDDASLIDHAAPQTLAREGESFTLALLRNPTGPTDMTNIAGTLLVDGRVDGRAVERSYAVQANVAAVSLASAEPMASAPALGWWEAILFALLGGIVLNAMPCVFPVLSLKVASLAGHGVRARVARDGFAYTAGVLSAVAVLAVVLLALRASGAAIGWGFQLQSPVFVAALAYILFLMGLSLSGVVQLGGSLASVGGGFSARSGAAGSFLTGVLATVVATPCTGPFMGAALGVAAAAPALDAFAIVLALGFGLALPFLLVCLVPGLARLLPRPGRWMEVLKQALAFPLYASAAWLMWVLAQQIDSAGLAFAFGGLLFVAFAAWLWRQVETNEGRDRAIARVFAVTASLGVVATLMPISAAAPPPLRAAAQNGPIAWENFTRARLAELTREGRPVLLNMTASWCLTCLVNERTAIETEAVRDALLRHGAVALKGDWTNRNPEITETLARFGRSGVPLTMVFPGNGRAPIILPELMAQSTLLAALGAER
jgi:thiol:disulfide interchange protein DsbD